MLLRKGDFVRTSIAPLGNTAGNVDSNAPRCQRARRWISTAPRSGKFAARWNAWGWSMEWGRKILGRKIASRIQAIGCRACHSGQRRRGVFHEVAWHGEASVVGAFLVTRLSIAADAVVVNGLPFVWKRVEGMLQSPSCRLLLSIRVVDRQRLCLHHVADGVVQVAVVIELVFLVAGVADFVMAANCGFYYSCALEM
ncbi:hypothetical protein TBK1r_00880 [Stieleria magnilauensis]|uniref:Uncharacterized protein n=1 Tax=Stieleria magnilauensis TaxID=2527963 RepID=A0ABX5XGP6_9BACT|nr:hypothetical protein TBK1r_00880 [Planctomycetes bacterium TBK1r]